MRCSTGWRRRMGPTLLPTVAAQASRSAAAAARVGRWPTDWPAAEVVLHVVFRQPRHVLEMRVQRKGGQSRVPGKAGVAWLQFAQLALESASRIIRGRRGGSRGYSSAQRARGGARERGRAQRTRGGARERSRAQRAGADRPTRHHARSRRATRRRPCAHCSSRVRNRCRFDLPVRAAQTVSYSHTLTVCHLMSQSDMDT